MQESCQISLPDVAGSHQFMPLIFLTNLNRSIFRTLSLKSPYSSSTKTIHDARPDDYSCCLGWCELLVVDDGSGGGASSRPRCGQGEQCRGTSDTSKCPDLTQEKESVVGWTVLRLPHLWQLRHIHSHTRCPFHAAVSSGTTWGVQTRKRVFVKTYFHPSSQQDMDECNDVSDGLLCKYLTLFVFFFLSKQVARDETGTRQLQTPPVNVRTGHNGGPFGATERRPIPYDRQHLTHSRWFRFPMLLHQSPESPDYWNSTSTDLNSTSSDFN